VAASVDKRVGGLIPLLLQRANAHQLVDLRRVVGDETRERVDTCGQLRRGGLVRREKTFVAGQQEAAQRAFLLADEPPDFLRIADDALRMLDPVDPGNEIQHERDESDGRDEPCSERQRNVAKENASKARFVDTGT